MGSNQLVKHNEEEVVATYGCAAPGTFLESVDINEMTAQYFTTNSQGTTITSGPEEKTIIEVQP